MATAEVNGINIYYELHGPEDAEVVVLSNGVMMSTASWGLVTPLLARHVRVLLYDCRGMWKSDHPEGPYSMEMHADDLAGLLDVLEIKKAHIAGISYGSEVSMSFALKYPEKTKSLVVVDGVSHVDPILKGQTYTWLLAAEGDNPGLLFHSSYGLNFSSNWLNQNQAFIESSPERFKAIKLESFAELMKAFYAFNITDSLGDITAPTLIIVGEKDILKSREYSEIIADGIPDNEFVVIPDSGHALCIEKPGILSTLILGFMVRYT